jgi:hypothetical protein
MVGRNVLDGRWTFQIFEEFDYHCWTVFREHERHLRNTFQGGVRHVIEAEMKERRRARTGGQDNKDAPPSEPDCSTDRREMAPGSVDIYGHRGTGRPE